MESAQKPLELILARNLITSISTPSFLLDDEARLVFFNEAAGALIGRSFEEVGQLPAEEWTKSVNSLDGGAEGLESLRLAATIKDGVPTHGSLTILGEEGRRHLVAASAIPIVSSERGSGALVMFWPEGDGSSD